MKAKKFKELCRRILHLEPNGWHAEMPDDWRLMICTRHGVEPMGSWFDEPHNKQILLCGESADRDEPIWHDGKEPELVDVDDLPNKKEEPVSEDLEKTIDTFLATYFGSEKEKQEWPFLKKMAIYFAKWQKEQFEKNRLKHCNSITNKQAELESDFIDQHLDKYQRMPTFLDAIEYGMRLKEQQMMANAIDGEVLENYDGKVLEYDDSILDEKLSNCRVLDKVKIIIIKED